MLAKGKQVLIFIRQSPYYWSCEDRIKILPMKEKDPLSWIFCNGDNDHIIFFRDEFNQGVT